MVHSIFPSLDGVRVPPNLPPGTSFKLIGLGGVGGIVARYLSIYLGSLEVDTRLVLIDGDAFDDTNVTRMCFSRFGNKAAVVRDDILQHSGDSRLTLLAIEEFVSKENLERLIQPGDVVVLAVDNHATRKLVNDFCATRRDDLCLISGGNDGIEVDAAGRQLRGTYGNVQIYLRRGGEDASPSLTHYHPEIATPVDDLPTEMSCAEAMSHVPQILFTNLMTAAALCNAIWLYLCGELHYSELSFEIHDGLMRPSALPAPQLHATPAATGTG